MSMLFDILLPGVLRNGNSLKRTSSSEEYYSCSSTSKRQRVDSSLKLVSGSFYIPKDDDSKPEGEDAHFVCEEEQTIGVADGVGGWAKYGIDAGEYARELMSNCELAIKNEPRGCVDPQRVLNSAYSDTLGLGSSTACIITLRNKSLHAVNVGDSGFRVFRRGEGCVYRSPVQQHQFNCPYQLGITKDHPSSAEVLEVPIEDGDVIIVGSDGLFDNVFDSEIEELVNQGITNGQKADEIACTIADLALYNSFDRFRKTPFSMEARKARVQHCGGKIDDISVIVAFVVS
ncbi:hypothetical protein IFM89_006970 [Coptis chinensis]|uniref:Protein phosphatase n=1 Tax=Coptis chinensis TaxID=261450 RepID=A0A835HDB4_9MAGN|nr:hypothetical protein IFM89_006970 [Coptis chinensis]